MTAASLPRARREPRLGRRATSSGPGRPARSGALRVLLWAQIVGMVAIGDRGRRPRRPPSGERGAARDPGRALRHARAVRLLPRHGDRGDERRRADRRRLGDRAGGLRHRDRRPALDAAARRRSPARSPASRSPRMEHQEAASGGSPRASASPLLAAIGFGFYFPSMHAAGRGRPLVELARLPDRPAARRSCASAVRVRHAAVRLGGWPLRDRARGRARRHARQPPLRRARSRPRPRQPDLGARVALPDRDGRARGASSCTSGSHRCQRVGIALTLAGVVLIAV